MISLLNLNFVSLRVVSLTVYYNPHLLIFALSCVFFSPGLHTQAPWACKRHREPRTCLWLGRAMPQRQGWVLALQHLFPSFNFSLLFRENRGPEWIASGCREILMTSLRGNPYIPIIRCLPVSSTYSLNHSTLKIIHNHVFWRDHFNKLPVEIVDGAERLEKQHGRLAHWVRNSCVAFFPLILEGLSWGCKQDILLGIKFLSALSIKQKGGLQCIYLCDQCV